MTDEQFDAVSEGPTAVMFSVWNINGGSVPEEAIKKIEKFLTRVATEYERHESVRLLTTTTRAE